MGVKIKVLDEGEQTILFRKGGIHEEGREFKVKYDRFFYTLHMKNQREELLKEKYRKDLTSILRVWD